ncbi:MAG: amidohydrolase family protein, partial [Oscillospiraceae bacterium]
MEILLKNGNLITHLGEILPRCDLLIRDNLICEVGGDIKSKTAQVIECTGKFIAPGFVAMHTHSPMNIFKGIAEDVNIDDWFNKEIWPYESKLTDDDIYWGAKLAAAEMLNNGITAFADHYFKSDIIAKACKELNIKADIAYTIFGFGGNCEEELATACHFCEEYKNDELINPRLGPHSTYLCCEAVLKTIVDTAKKLGVGIHIHLSESQAQVTQSKAMNDGKTPFAVLDKVGGFNIPCIVAHGLYIEDEDIKFLKDDTCVAVCPKTYMKLGMGQGNLWRLHHKLNIVSGNDGSASS